MMRTGRSAVALSIAGSDSSAGAGIQADLKTFSALGIYGLTAVTCVVAEIPGKVSRIEPASARIVREQIEVLAKNFQIGAIKTGLLCSAEIISAVAKATSRAGSHRSLREGIISARQLDYAKSQ
jgi:hydroxymethylpyrimidine/phosphomethylpyrimidine kinase